MKVLSIFALIALMGMALAGPEDVLILTKDNFEETISGDSTVFVKFYAPWCGHCKKMKEPYEEAAASLKGKAVLAEVDATIEKELAEQFGVQGFPTLKLFQGGEVVVDYSGARDEKSMVSFVENALLPPVQEMDAEAAKAAMEDEKAVLAFVKGEGVDDAFKAFEGVARKVKGDLAGKAVFVTVEGDAAAALKAKSDGKAGQVIIKNAGEGADAIWSTVDVTDNLSQLALFAAVPPFGELSRETAQLYIQHPVVCHFADPDNEAHEKQKVIMTEAAKKLVGNGKVLFAWINGVELVKFKEQLGLTSDPALAIVEFEGLVKYIYEDEGDFTAEKVTAFVQKYIDGTLTPNLKSADIPETNDEPVKVVVGKTWDDIVMDDGKDVLIEQYAPWCGHCKKLEPIYTDLATKLSSVESIVIAKMDATENDAPPPHAAKGYPTIIFFPAGKKEAAIPYNGGRTLDEMMTFLKENATNKFEVPEAKAEEAEEEEDDDEKEDL